MTADTPCLIAFLRRSYRPPRGHLIRHAQYFPLQLAESHI